MKNFISFLFAMAMCIGLATGAYAQTDSSATSEDKSSTISSLCEAQEEVIQEVLNDLYISNGKIDVIKAYEAKIKPRIAECLETDMIETGIKVRDNALEGKFKKIKLKFEKPEDKTFKISGKAKRTYLRAYKKFKKEFVDDRKNKTLNEVMGNENLKKKVDKVAKVMTKEFKKNIHKVSK